MKPVGGRMIRTSISVISVSIFCFIKDKLD
jgi:hypothetical protein